MRLKPANFKGRERASLAERFGSKTENLPEVDTRILRAWWFSVRFAFEVLVLFKRLSLHGLSQLILRIQELVLLVAFK